MLAGFPRAGVVGARLDSGRGVRVSGASPAPAATRSSSAEASSCGCCADVTAEECDDWSARNLCACTCVCLWRVSVSAHACMPHAHGHTHTHTHNAHIRSQHTCCTHAHTAPLAIASRPQLLRPQQVASRPLLPVDHPGIPPSLLQTLNRPRRQYAHNTPTRQRLRHRRTGVCLGAGLSMLGCILRLTGQLSGG